jgi:hypothetical protein
MKFNSSFSILRSETTKVVANQEAGPALDKTGPVSPASRYEANKGGIL